MSQKSHDLFRKLQLIFAAASGALGVLSASIDLGRVGVIATAVLAACGYFVGYMAEHDSAEYFSTRSIVTKIVPDIVTDIVTDEVE